MKFFGNQPLTVAIALLFVLMTNCTPASEEKNDKSPGSPSRHRSQSSAENDKVTIQDPTRRFTKESRRDFFVPHSAQNAFIPSVTHQKDPAHKVSSKSGGPGSRVLMRSGSSRKEFVGENARHVHLAEKRMKKVHVNGSEAVNKADKSSVSGSTSPKQTSPK